jgi:hypothetical protein
VFHAQTIDQQREYFSLRPGRRFGAEPFDDRHRRQLGGKRVLESSLALFD